MKTACGTGWVTNWFDISYKLILDPNKYLIYVVSSKKNLTLENMIALVLEENVKYSRVNKSWSCSTCRVFFFFLFKIMTLGGYLHESDNRRNQKKKKKKLMI